jgi:hypothetical protein
MIGDRPCVVCRINVTIRYKVRQKVRNSEPVCEESSSGRQNLEFASSNPDLVQAVKPHVHQRNGLIKAVGCHQLDLVFCFLKRLLIS